MTLEALLNKIYHLTSKRFVPINLANDQKSKDMVCLVLANEITVRRYDVQTNFQIDHTSFHLKK